MDDEKEAGGKSAARRIAAGAGAGLLALTLGWNALVALPVASRLAADDPGGPAYVVAHRTWLLHPNQVTLELVRVSDDAAPADLWFALALAAQALDGQRVGEVRLSRRLDHRLSLSGEDFAAIGRAMYAHDSFAGVVTSLGLALRYADGAPVMAGPAGADDITALTAAIEASSAAAAEWARD